MKTNHFIYKHDGLYYMPWVPEIPKRGSNQGLGLFNMLNYESSLAQYKAELERAKAEAVICDSSIVSHFFNGMYDDKEFLSSLGGLDPNKIYTINIEEEIEIIEEPEFPGFDHTSYPIFKRIARIAAPKNERYFLFSYIGDSEVGNIKYHGNVCFGYNGFPSKNTINDCIKQVNPSVDVNTIAIQNIFEFKDKSDFDNFSRS